MANEITVLEQGANRSAQLFFIYPIASPAQVGGSNMVPTPATGQDNLGNSVSVLPDIAERVLTPPEKASLDAGTSVWEIVTFRPAVGLTGAQLITEARRVYAANKSAFDTRYLRRFGRAGQRFNA